MLPLITVGCLPAVCSFGKHTESVTKALCADANHYALFERYSGYSWKSSSLQNGLNLQRLADTTWSSSPCGCVLLTVTTQTTLAPINNLDTFYKLSINQVLLQNVARDPYFS